MDKPSQKSSVHDGASPYGSQYYGNYYGGYGSGLDDTQGGLDVRGWLRFLRRRKLIILTVTAIGLVISIVMAMRKVPVYTAQAQVLIEGDQRIVDLGTSVADAGTGSSANDVAIRTEINLFKSGDLLGRLVERLYGHEIELARLEPETLAQPTQASWVQEAVWTAGAWFADAGLVSTTAAGATDASASASADEKGSKVLDHVWSWAGALLPQGWLVAPPSEQEVAALSPEQAADLVRKRRLSHVANGLRIQQLDRSMIISVAFSSPNPAEAARIVNALADLYVDQRLQQKKALTAGANEFLENRLVQLEQEVRQTEIAIEEFIRQNDVSTSTSIGVGNRQLDDLTSLLVESRATRKERETRLQFIEAQQARGGSMQALTEVLQSPYISSLWQEDGELRRQLAELRSIYRDEHPAIIDILEEREDVQRRMNDEVARVVQNLRNELRVAREREISIQADIDALMETSGSVGQNEIELRRLEREADATRQIYESFLQRYKETREQQALVDANARVIERADPPSQPSSGNPNRIIATGGFLSLALGLGLAYLREKLDNGVRSGKEIEHAVGLPYLGLTPFLSTRHRKGRKIHEHMLAKPLSAYTESIRQLYTVLRLANVDKPPKVVQLTSSVPQEGKTTISVSLAIALAMDGKSTILVDGDMRHPSVERELAGKQGDCLVGYLQGDCELAEAIYTHEQSGLDVLPVRQTPPNPARLIASGRMKSIIERLREDYDYVIVDSPPVLGMSDTKSLLEMADVALFVARWEHTTIDMVVDAVNELNACNADIIGVVVAQVDINKHSLYGYGGIDNHYSRYRKYYQN